MDIIDAFAKKNDTIHATCVWKLGMMHFTQILKNTHKLQLCGQGSLASLILIYTFSLDSTFDWKSHHTSCYVEDERDPLRLYTLHQHALFLSNHFKYHALNCVSYCDIKKILDNAIILQDISMK